jgi:alcohol dehydrogenase class-P
VAVLVGVPHKDAVFKTNPIQFLTEKTLKGTFYGHYKPRTDIPVVVEQYLKGVHDLLFFFNQDLSV